MKTAYLDAFSGLSGDMIVGALLDCGADLDELKRVLDSLPLKGYRVATRRKMVSGISALKFEVEVLEPQPERHLGEIRAIIEAGDMSPSVKRDANAIFAALAEAEAKVHRISPEKVHFHEVGAVDSIVDVVGCAWGFQRLGVESIVVTPLPAGSGLVRSAHGVIPVPAPATTELLAGFPVRLGDGTAEMVTPTGAAVLKALARPAPAMLSFEIQQVGYGAGAREFADRPNVLRIMLGEARPAFAADEMIEIETNIDDLNPQIYDHVTERLLAAGARDVTITPTIMKKGRPGVTLSVIAETAKRDEIAGLIFAETSTIGLRFHRVERLKLDRAIVKVATRWGEIRVKVSGADGRTPSTLAPEYEDCRRAALEHRVALRQVMEDALAAARKQLG
jgi:pyridinium-3,5-bisthiocarboxylic acid mononucleotide nickel chelatase